MTANFLKRYFKNGKAAKWWNPAKDQKCTDVVMLVEPKGKKILDAGAGKGRFLIDFLNEECKFILALDISNRMLKISKERMQNLVNERISFVVGDIEHLPLKNAFFDIALCVDTLVHMSNPKKGLQELARVVKDGGKVVVDVTVPLSIRSISDFPFEPLDLLTNLTAWFKQIIYSIAGSEVLWKFHRVFLSHFMTPWISYSKYEFHRFIKSAHLRPLKSIDYRMSRKPSIYLTVSEKSKS